MGEASISCGPGKCRTVNLRQDLEDDWYRFNFYEVQSHSYVVVVNEVGRIQVMKKNECKKERIVSAKATRNPLRNYGYRGLWARRDFGDGNQSNTHHAVG